MASLQPSKLTGNSSTFRTRGASIALVCVLVVNALLIVVVPALRPGKVIAQDANPDVVENADQRKPDNVQAAETVGLLAVDAASEPAEASRQVVATRVTQHKDQEQAAMAKASASENQKPSADNQVLLGTADGAANDHSTESDDWDIESFVASQTEERSSSSDERPRAETESEVSSLVPLVSSTLLVVNPADSGGTVLYLVDGEVHRLSPGESHELADGREHRIEFHRGQDFGDAEVILSTGTYQFRVDESGWKLDRAESE